jgi:ankyrin repeat protein
LIRVGANVDAKIYPNAKNGGTALMWVANVEIAKLLIQANANVSATNEYGKTALMRAAELNRLEVLQIFIAAGADVNAADQDGNTALMYAALEGHIKIVEALVEQGADVDATNHEGKTAALQVTSGQPNGSEIEKILTAASSSKPQ